MAYKEERDEIGMEYESQHIIELLSVQCLQVNDVIAVLFALLKTTTL